MPHGKKTFVDSFANIWMVDYVMIIFAMVRYNKYEYLKQDVFPLEQQEDLKKKKKDISVIQKYSAVLMHTWGRLSLLSVFGKKSQKYTKSWQFLYLSGNL